MKMSREEIVARLNLILNYEDTRDSMCILYDSGPNTFAQLEDLLEDCGIAKEAFAEAVNTKFKGKIFHVERGRLRIKTGKEDEDVCLSILNECSCTSCLDIRDLDRFIMPLIKD